jgi:hypothetical protein
MTDDELLSLVRAVDWEAVLMSLDSAIDNYNLSPAEQAEHDALRDQIEAIATAQRDGADGADC